MDVTVQYFEGVQALANDGLAGLRPGRRARPAHPLSDGDLTRGRRQPTTLDQLARRWESLPTSLSAQLPSADFRWLWLKAWEQQVLA